MALYRDSAFYLVGRGLPAVLSLLTAGIYTRLVPPEELGSFVLAIAVASFAHSVLFQWLGASLVRFASRFEGRRSSFLRTVAATFGGLAAVTLILAAICWLALGDHPARQYVPLGTAALFALAIFELHLDLLRSRLATGSYSLTFFLRAALTLLFSWQLARLGYGSPGLILGFAAGWALAPVPAARLAWRGDGPGSVEPELLGQLLRYGLPLALTVLLESFVWTSDRMLLGALAGSEEAGLYGVSAQLAMNTLRVTLHAISLAVLPRAALALESLGAEAARRELAAGLDVMLAIGLPATAGFAILSGNIAHIVLGPEYREAATTLLPIVALAMLLYGLRHFYVDQSFQLGRRTALQAPVAAVGAAVALTLNLLLIPWLGMRGAAWGLVASQLLALGLAWRLGRRVFRLPGSAAQLLRIAAATALMGPALWWLAPGRGPVALLGQIGVGAAVDAVGLLLTDGARLRTLLLSRLRTG